MNRTGNSAARSLRLRPNIKGWVVAAVGIIVALGGILGAASPELKVFAAVAGGMIAIVGIVLANVAFPWQARRRTRRSVLRNDVVTRDGAFPTIMEVDPIADLGLRKSVAGFDHYVPRPELIKTIQEGLRGRGRALIVGEPITGKTWLAVEAIRRDAEFAGCQLVIPKEPETIRELLEDDTLSSPDGCIVVFPDYSQFLDGVSRQDLDDLHKLGNRVLATMDIAEYDAATGFGSRAKPNVNWFDDPIEVPNQEREWKRLAAGVTDDPEFARAISTWGLAQYLAGAAMAADTFDRAQSKHPYAYALTSAAVDWCRTGIGERAPKDVVRRLADSYLMAAGNSTDRVDAEIRAKDETWVESEIEGVFRLLTSHGSTWIPHPTLITVVERRAADALDGRIPESTWAAIAEADVAPDAAFRAAGRADDEYPFSPHVVALLRRAASTGDPDAGVRLAARLIENDDLDGAERVLRPIADQLPLAMADLGLVLWRTGRKQESERAFKLSVQSGDPDAVLVCVGWLKSRGDETTVESLVRTAVTKTESPELMAELALLLQARRSSEASTWYNRASVAGPGALSAGASTRLGRFLFLEGQPETADPWLRPAAQHGDVPAMIDLSQCLSIRGRAVEAETWARRAIARFSSTYASNALGFALENQGRLDDAESSYREAVEGGSREALANLGRVLKQQSKFEEAERVLLDALKAGVPLAAYTLALLYEDLGDQARARTFLEIAYAAGVPEALEAVRRMGGSQFQFGSAAVRDASTDVTDG